MIIALYIVIAVVVFIFVFRPLFTTQGQVERMAARTSRRRRLLEEREMLYESIRELDFDYRMGKVEEADYKDARSRYEGQAVELMKAIDQGNGRVDAVEDRIEQEVAALRKKEKPACAECGGVIPMGARFCPQCGKAIGG